MCRVVLRADANQGRGVARAGVRIGGQGADGNGDDE
jgi:hypothetical protein